MLKFQSLQIMGNNDNMKSRGKRRKFCGNRYARSSVVLERLGEVAEKGVAIPVQLEQERTLGLDQGQPTLQ